MKSVLILLVIIACVAAICSNQVVNPGPYDTTDLIDHYGFTQQFKAPITGELKSLKFYLYWYDNGGGGSPTNEYDSWEFDFYNADFSSQIFGLPGAISSLATPSSPTDGYVIIDNINMPVTQDQEFWIEIYDNNNNDDMQGWAWAHRDYTTYSYVADVIPGGPYTMYFEASFVCVGGTSGDPHFYGFNGQYYTVMGQSYEVYNLITAPYLQINSHFTPYFKNAGQAVPTGTMIGDLGIKFNSHSFYINSNSSFSSLDHSDISMSSDWVLNYENGITLSNKVQKNSYEITLRTADVELTFMRKVYMVSGLEPQYHFDYKAKLLQVNNEMHGLLGQSWSDKFFEDKVGAFKYLDGEEDDYRIKSNNVFGDDFPFNKFQNL